MCVQTMFIVLGHANPTPPVIYVLSKRRRRRRIMLLNCLDRNHGSWLESHLCISTSHIIIIIIIVIHSYTDARAFGIIDFSTLTSKSRPRRHRDALAYIGYNNIILYTSVDRQVLWYRLIPTTIECWASVYVQIYLEPRRARDIINNRSVYENTTNTI